jgi:hypothetical protein
LPYSVRKDVNDVPFLVSRPEVVPVLTASTVDDDIVVVCLGVRNRFARPIKNVSLNFRVPNNVSLTPSDEFGAPIARPKGRLMRADEILIGDDRKPYGSAIKYWAEPNIEFVGRWSSVFFFAVRQLEPGRLPVRVTLSSPDLVEPFELNVTFDPKLLPEVFSPDDDISF